MDTTKLFTHLLETVTDDNSAKQMSSLSERIGNEVELWREEKVASNPLIEVMALIHAAVVVSLMAGLTKKQATELFETNPRWKELGQ